MTDGRGDDAVADTDLPDFDTPRLAKLLDAMTPAEWDQLPFGLIVMDRAGVVTHYNADESRRAGLDAARVLGRNFFTDVGPCTNNYLIADRYHRLDPATGALDDTFDYVFTFRMAWTPVRLRLLADPGSPNQFLAVESR
ncbi:MAG: PAS domain-containing protein [Jatrophihabitans sp.]|uniref:PAS domain-containing protein n=1 Tax=Jatrophihabitans sp. TaxID=1932789 RepID=UPI003F7F28E1